MKKPSTTTVSRDIGMVFRKINPSGKSFTMAEQSHYLFDLLPGEQWSPTMKWTDPTKNRSEAPCCPSIQ